MRDRPYASNGRTQSAGIERMWRPQADGLICIAHKKREFRGSRCLAQVRSILSWSRVPSETQAVLESTV